MNKYVYTLTDRNGNVIARGKKKDVYNVFNTRYVFNLIFDDILYREKVEG